MELLTKILVMLFFLVIWSLCLVQYIHTLYVLLRIYLRRLVMFWGLMVLS